MLYYFFPIIFPPLQVVLAALLAVSHGAPAAPAGYAPAPYEAYPDIAPSYNVSDAPDIWRLDTQWSVTCDRREPVASQKNVVGFTPVIVSSQSQMDVWISWQRRIWNVSYVPDEDHLQPDYPEALPTSILFEYISAGRDVFKTPGTPSAGWAHVWWEVIEWRLGHE